MSVVLRMESFRAWRGRSEIVRGVELEVEEGDLVCLLGSNGAGKTTLIDGLMGVIQSRASRLEFAGRPLGALRPWNRVRAGLVTVPQERYLFPGLTVHQNLTVGRVRAEEPGRPEFELRDVYELFPRLEERSAQHAGTLSGGERSMLAIARALMLRPRLLILDEPSLGLAPIVVSTIMQTIAEINRRGLSVLLVEQNVHQALRLARRGYLLENGRFVLSGTAEELLHSPLVESGYLGTAATGGAL